MNLAKLISDLRLKISRMIAHLRYIFRHRTFASRLSLTILSMITIISIAAFVVYYIIARNLILNSVKSNVVNISEKTVNGIENILLSAEKIPSNLAHVLENTSFDEEQLHTLMRTVVEHNDEIYGSAVAFEPYSFNKKEYYYSPYMYKDSAAVKYVNLGVEAYDYFYHDWYQIPKHLGKPLWSEPYFDEGGGGILMSTYSVPFYKTVNGEKTFWGIVTVDISLDWLEKIISDIKIYESGYAFLISRNGTVVTHPEAKYIMNETIFSIAEKFKQPELRDMGRKMTNGETGFASMNSVLHEKDAWIEYMPLPSSKWALGIVIPENELYSDLTFISLTIFIIGLIGLALLFTTIIILSNKLTAPLHTFAEATREIASGNFNLQLPKIKTTDEIIKLHDSFEHMQSELRHYVDNLKTTTQIKEKIESELRIAHEIQMGMIPKSFPPFPDRSDIDLFAVLESAKEVGGDLYDFFFIDRDKLCVAIGDVSGKGVPASLFMAVTRTLLRSKANKHMTTQDLCNLINLDLIEDNESFMFVTFFLGIIDLNKGELQYTNAGHNYPYIVKTDGTIQKIISKHGMPLGLDGSQLYEYDTIKLDTNDRIVLYTDGVTEAMNPNKSLYNNFRLEKSCRNFGGNPTRQCVELVMSDIKEFTKEAEQSDDITIFIIQYKG